MPVRKSPVVVKMVLTSKEYNLLDNFALIAGIESPQKSTRCNKMGRMMIRLCMEAYLKRLDKNAIRDAIDAVDSFGIPINKRAEFLANSDVKTRDDLRSLVVNGQKNSDIYDQPLHPDEGWGINKPKDSV